MLGLQSDEFQPPRQLWVLRGTEEVSDLLGDVPHDPGGRSKPKWPAGSVISARFGGPRDCYRYELMEIWGKGRLAMFLMMNPSVASLAHADPTLIRTGAFARRWGYGGQLIANVHAYRITDSKLLAGVADPVGPDNDAAILSMASRADIVVLAYGLPPNPLRARAAVVVDMLRSARRRLTYLALSKDGTPQHPLYLPRDLVPLDYPPDDAETIAEVKEIADAR